MTGRKVSGTLHGLDERGLTVHEEHHYIRIIPDGIIRCRCQPSRLMEKKMSIQVERYDHTRRSVSRDNQLPRSCRQTLVTKEANIGCDCQNCECDVWFGGLVQVKMKTWQKISMISTAVSEHNNMHLGLFPMFI